MLNSNNFNEKLSPKVSSDMEINKGHGSDLSYIRGTKGIIKIKIHIGNVFVAQTSSTFYGDVIKQLLMFQVMGRRCD